MGKVSAFALEALELFFNSSDHLAPHFHAERSGEWEARIFFLRAPVAMVEVKWALKTPPKKVLRALCAQAKAHRAELLEEWERKVSVITPGPEQ